MKNKIGRSSRATCWRALERLRALPFEDIGFAKVDHHRDLRQGHPEAIFGAGKTPDQIVQIMARMRENGSNILVTRCSSDAVATIVAEFPGAQYLEAARAVTLDRGVHAIEVTGGVAALHLDLHVYVTQPQQRFIFVNSRKYKEGDTLAEGPLVEEITPEGAVLNFRGSRFKLSND